MLCSQFNTANVSRNDLRKFLSELDLNEISYDITGPDLLEFDESELDEGMQDMMDKIGIIEL